MIEIIVLICFIGYLAFCASLPWWAFIIFVIGIIFLKWFLKGEIKQEAKAIDSPE